MRIRVKGFFTFKTALGGDGTLDLDLPTPTLQTVLDRLAKQCGPDLRQLLFNPQTGQLYPDNQILLNGRHCRHLPQGLATLLKENDLVTLFPPVAGG